MFVVTRRVSESILIGDDIVITVTHVRGRRVRIAVDAPHGTTVGRLTAPPPFRIRSCSPSLREGAGSLRPKLAARPC